MSGGRIDRGWRVQTPSSAFPVDEAPVSVGVLGGVRVEVAGGELALGGLRSRRMFAALLLGLPGDVPISRLIDILWEVAPDSARQQIHNAMADIRKRLALTGRVEVRTTPLGYRLVLDDGVEVDLWRFQDMTHRAKQAEAAGDTAEASRLASRALDLWRGPALDGMEGAFFENVAVKLDEDRLAAFEMLLRLRVRDGDTEAVGQLRKLVAEHPGRDSLRMLLMAALQQAGRQADALAVFDEGRRLLAEEFGLSPSQDLVQLHERILRNLPLHDADEPPSHDLPSAPDEPLGGDGDDRGPGAHLSGHRPQCLPHDPSDFSGRTSELSRLAEARTPSGPASLVISAISGMGGVGKTALAVRFAHTVAEEYPDGQFFLDLRGFTVGLDPLPASEALASLLRQCGVLEELIPPDADSRSTAWRAAMAGKRAIVLLDNANSESQVRPLLPGASGQLVVITSRRRLSLLEGSSHLLLDVLGVQDAAQLFIGIAGSARVPESDLPGLAQVIEYCGRLPLAVRIAASRFRDRESWTIEYLVGLLSDVRRRYRLLGWGEQNVLAVLRVSYRYLSSEQRRMFRLLSMCPTLDFDAEIAAALAGVDEAAAEPILESLVDDNLLQEESPGRYRFHDIIRDCARGLLEEDEPEELRSASAARLLDYYIAYASERYGPLARAAFRFVPDAPEPGPDGIRRSAERASLQTAERDPASLIEVAKWALGTGFARRAWQLVIVLQPLMRRMCYAEPSLDLFTQALGAARADGDPRGETLCLMGTALALRDNSRLEEAFDSLQAALATARGAGDDELEMHALVALGGVHQLKGDPAEATVCLKAALSSSASLGDAAMTASLQNNLGLCSVDLGDFEAAGRYFREAMVEYERVGALQSRSYALLNMADLLNLQCDYEGAIALAQESIASARDGELNQVRAAGHAVLAVSFRAVGSLAEALAEGRKALMLARENNVLDMECEALAAVGEAHLAAGSLEAATGAFQNCLTLSRQRDMKTYSARASEGLGHVALREADPRTARRMFAQAIESYGLAAHARFAELHLVSELSPDVTCLRCVSGPRP